MTITVGKSIPTMSPDIFNVVEMDTPAGVKVGIAFPVKVKINADPTSPVYSTWEFFRDSGNASFDIQLFAESIGPGAERELTTTPHNEPLIAGQDNYDITLNPNPAFPATARKGVYELATVITLVSGGTPVGWSAFVADVPIQVS